MLRQDCQERTNVSIKEKLTGWEQQLQDFIHCKMTTDNQFSKNKVLSQWMSQQRRRGNELLKNHGADSNNRSLQARTRMQKEIAVLDRLDFPWVVRANRKFEDWLLLLKEFHETNGHVRVPQVHPVLGEWIKCMRKEYEVFHANQDDPTKKTRKSRLNQERIDAMNKLGFVWKIRFGRPRKGDERFRLRHKSYVPANDDDNDDTANDNTASSPLASSKENANPAAATAVTPGSEDNEIIILE
jgi:hypothetical protein